MHTGKLTPDELESMFGKEMPIEAARLLFDADPSVTVGEVRAKIREFAISQIVKDCTFLYFKTTGKWGYEGRGKFPPSGNVTRQEIMEANAGTMPGIVSDARDMIVVVIPDNDCTEKYAYPRMLFATHTGSVTFMPGEPK